MVQINSNYIGKGYCKLLIRNFINSTKYINKNYYLSNAGGIPSYNCYFNNFSTEYDVYTFKSIENFSGIVDLKIMIELKVKNEQNVDVWMFFVKKNVLASASVSASASAHEGGNNKKLYHKLINYLNFSL
jgi:hypothetical protein